MGRLRGRSLPSRLAAPPSRLALPVGEAERLRQRDSERPNWYQTARWQKLRLARLDHDGWVCRQTGALLVGVYPAWNSPAVDHIEPHHWDPALFWAFDNLQSVTKQWHDSEKQRREKLGLI
jgi:5-methylcytosine-specific restriction enzyme A